VVHANDSVVGSERQVVRTAVLAGANLIPGAGSAVAVLIDAGWPDRWKQKVTTLLNELLVLVPELSERIESLSDRDYVMLNVAARASTHAIDEHISTLAAACANAIATDSWSTDVALSLLRIVSEMTPSHIKVLSFLADPTRWPDRLGCHPDGRYCDAYGNSGIDVLSTEWFVAQGWDRADITTIVSDLGARGFFGLVGFGIAAHRDDLIPQVRSITLDVVGFVTWDPSA
jgi:hypothetical protein